MRAYSLLLAVFMVQSGVGFASSTPRDRNETKRCVIFADIEEVRKECEERRSDRQELPWHLRDASVPVLERYVRETLADLKRKEEEHAKKNLEEAEKGLEKAENELKQAERELKEGLVRVGIDPRFAAVLLNLRLDSLTQ